MAYIQENLAQGRWFELSLMEQLGNIGSEIERAISWQKKNDYAYRDKAFDRALELIELTIMDTRWAGRRKELCRMKEVVCDFFFGENRYHTSEAFLKNYFLAFALAARRDR